MDKLVRWCAALLGAACACAPAPALRHASDGWEEDVKKSLQAILERFLVNMRRNGNRQFEVKPAAGPDPVALEGAEAQEVVVDQIPAGSAQPLMRHYVAHIRSRSKPQIAIVWYANLPGLFDHGLADVKDLVRRMRF